MGSLFRASEVIEVGILVEKNGDAFYSSLKDLWRAKKLREIFDYLAGEEKRHIQIFQGLLGTVERYQPHETYEGEYMGYMKDLADRHVFTKEGAGKAQAQKVTTPPEAIDMALGFEQDSIEFFDSMRRFVRESEHKIIYQLIDEEHNHIKVLTELKDELSRR